MKVAVVLANWMDTDGNLNADTTARVTAGIALLGIDHTHLLLMGWAGVPGTDLPIATAMQRFCLAQNVLSDAILTDIRSRDTVGDAIFARLTLDNMTPATPISVVTSDYHLARTQLIFERVFGDSRTLEFIGAKAEPRNTDTETNSIAAFNATFDAVPNGDIAAFIDRLMSDHPFYNGTIHPQITRPD